MIIPENYFNKVIETLVFTEIVRSFNVLRKRIIGNELYFRIKIFYTNRTVLEISNYLCFNYEIKILRYSYNWFNNKDVIIRWDNAEHHKEIDNFPFHKHIRKEKIVPDKPRFIFEILEFIENEIGKNS